MDILEQFLNRISYKFPKGYPDMNNPNDVIILESELSSILETKITISEKKSLDFLKPEAKEIADFISKKLDIDIEDIKAATTSRLLILSDDRKGLFAKLEQLGYKKDSNIVGSSQGGYKTQDGIEIIVKPKSGQGGQSSGKQNESSFFELINNKIDENVGPITVILKSDKKTLKYNNISGAVDSSVAGATSFEKADAQLLDPRGKTIANISLKKRNAVRWESSKTRNIDGINVFKTFIEKALANEFPNVVLKPIEGNKGKYKLYQPEKDVILSKVIIKNTPEDVLDDVVFGNDNPKTVVVKEDFENFSNFTFENGVLTINVYKIYTDVEDLMGTDDEPVYAFSNHVGQAYGVEFRSFSKGLLYKDESLKGSSEEIDFNSLK